MLDCDTAPKFLKRNYERWGDRQVAMRRKDFGIWQEYTWKDSYEMVKHFSLGLINLGFQPGDKISILGESNPEWWWAEFAAQAAHGAVVGIFADSTPPEVKYIVEHSDSTFVVAEDQEQIDKILDIKDELHGIKKVIYWDPKGLWGYEDPILASWNEVIDLGREYDEANPGLFEQMVEETREDDVAFFCYTSGTTSATPKGVMHSHKFFTAIHKLMMPCIIMREGDSWFSYLAPVWIAEQLTGIPLHLISGTTVYFPEGPETAQADVREAAPQALFYGSRMWENMLSTIQVTISDASPLKRFVYNLFLPVGYKIADFNIENRIPRLFWRILHYLANWITFRPLQDKLGLLKTRNPLTAGSALGAEAIRYFQAIGVNLEQWLGITEVGMVSGHSSDDVKPESSGPPRSIVRISDEGEIQVKSPAQFIGYYKDADLTKKSVVDGWFHTGDAGYIGDDGHLIYYDRMVDMKQLGNGYKFAPQYIENGLKFSPYIKDVMVFGSEDVDCVSAIINIDFGNVGKWAENHHIAYTTFVDLSQKSQTYELIGKDIKRINRTMVEQGRVRKYVLLHKEFDPDEAELTRTRKLRRAFMEQRYRYLLDAIYADKQEITAEAEVKYRDGRTGKISTSLKIESIEDI